MRNAHDRSLSVDLNKSGSSTFWLPTQDELSRYVYPWSTAVAFQYLDEQKNEFIFWSGLVQGRVTDMASGRVNVSVVDWYDRLMRLNLQDLTLEFSDQDAGFIAFSLLEKARELDPNLPITIGTIEPTQLRTITYQRDQSIGQAIIDLATIEAGYDWYIDPVDITLNIVAKRGIFLKEQRWTFFGDGKSLRSNCSNVVESVDGTVVANDIRPRGEYNSGFAVDTDSQARYGVFMDQPSLSDVVETDILNAYANAEIVYRAQPRVTYSITPKPNTSVIVPRLFRDFDIGDSMPLTARRDFIDIEDQPIRIFGVSLGISDQGTETLSNLQTTEA